MNRRMRTLLMDTVIAVVISVALHCLVTMINNPIMHYGVALAVTPLIWLALRHGSAAAVVGGAVAGGIIATVEGTLLSVSGIVETVLPLLTAGLAGFFAKYTQKTLNNRRFQSTYLNVTVGTFVVVASYMVLKYLISPMAMGTESSLLWTSLNFWVILIGTWVINSFVICLIASRHSAFLIPKRTKYLSREETTSLLND